MEEVEVPPHAEPGPHISFDWLECRDLWLMGGTVARQEADGPPPPPQVSVQPQPAAGKVRRARLGGPSFSGEGGASDRILVQGPNYQRPPGKTRGLVTLLLAAPGMEVPHGWRPPCHSLPTCPGNALLPSPNT